MISRDLLRVGVVKVPNIKFVKYVFTILTTFQKRIGLLK